MTDPQHLSQYVKNLLGDLDAAADRVQRRCQSSMAEAMGLEGAGGETHGETLPPAQQRLATAGIEGLQKLQQGRSEHITPEQQDGLEAIVLLEARPAITVRGGDFGAPPEEWSILRQHRDGIRNSIRRVGRIELAGHPKYDWLGTGFLVGPTAVVTNRHVAIKFSQKDDSGEWIFKEGMSSSVDLVKEARSAESMEYVVTEILGLHPRYDMAVLRVEPASTKERALPEPLQLASRKPEDLKGRSVYVVGYPAKDARRNVPLEMERIFQEIYEVKRLQPGRLIHYTAGDYSMHHDCSTLGGNSGSPLFDLQTHEVIGLHFAGRYQTANFAVPFWMLTDDPLLKTAEANFT